MRLHRRSEAETPLCLSWFSLWGACLMGGAFLFLATSVGGALPIISHPTSLQVRCVGPLEGKQFHAGDGIVVGWIIEHKTVRSGKGGQLSGVSALMHVVLIGPFPSAEAIHRATSPDGVTVNGPVALSSLPLVTSGDSQTVTSTLYLPYEQRTGYYDLVQTALIRTAMSRTLTQGQTIVVVDPPIE